jgi:hypothetical protein
MPANPLIKGSLEAVSEGTGNIIKSAGEEAKSIAKGFEAQLLYGTTTLTHEDINRGYQQDNIQKKQTIEEIRAELPKHSDTSGNSPINIDAVRNAQQGGRIEPHVPTPPKFKSAQHRQMFEGVQRLGEEMIDRENRLKQQAAAANTEPVKQDELPSLEMPAGRQTGLNLKFNRKSNLSRGLSKLRVKSGETKAGFGKDT